MRNGPIFAVVWIGTLPVRRNDLVIVLMCQFEPLTHFSMCFIMGLFGYVRFVIVFVIQRIFIDL